MIFIAAGEGGGTGTGAAPIVAEIAKETGALTVAVVTKPFVFEGQRRKTTAEDGVDKLRDKVDTLIVIPNQKVLEIIDSKVTILEAFKKVDSILHQGVKGIAELITVPGLINVDFADVRAIMSTAGTALMGIGRGSGEKRTHAAIKQAISSPMLETSIQGARGILFNIVGGEDLTMAEVDEAASILAKTADPDAEIIFGAAIKKEMEGEVQITLIATKLGERTNRFSQFHAAPPKKTDETDIADLEEKPMREDNESENENYDIEGDDGDLEIPAFLRKK